MGAMDNHSKKANLPIGGRARRGDRLWRRAVSAILPLSGMLIQENDRWFLWIPVLLGSGIALYFSLKFEPPLFLVLIVFVLALALAVLPGMARPAFPLLPASPLFMSILLIVGGVLVASARSHLVAAPVVEKQLGPVRITGWIERISGKADGSRRLVILPLEIARLTRARYPVRIQLTSRLKMPPLKSGDVVQFRAILLPPPGPARPGGFSYARMAWFERIGASGFLVSPPELQPPRPQGILMRINAQIQKIRTSVTRHILEGAGKTTGAIAAALITGEKGALSPELRNIMRSAGLAHLLAISGLHMVLFGGAIFALSRALLALSARLTLRYPIKKWAAFIALLGALAYLVLSGASIATQRAFIMISIMFLAIILDRQALTMRNVALAALVILLMRPESLFNVSFQMSFAAVIALIAVYETGIFRIATARPGFGQMGMAVRFFLLFFLGNVLTSIIAGSATGPFAAYHFHRVALYGVLGNIAAVPLMGLLVMPAALIALIAMPFGLESIPLTIMGYGISLIVDIARQVSDLPGAVRLVADFHMLALPFMTAGGLWLCLWRRVWRFAGIIPVAAGLVLAPYGDKPDILIARDGKNLALRDAAGKLRVLDPRKDAYSVRKWLEADGDARTPREAANPENSPFSCDALACIAQIGSGKLMSYIRSPAALEEDCQRAEILISPMAVSRIRCKRPAHVIDIHYLKQNGATSLTVDGHKIRIRTVARDEGKRPWSSLRKTYLHKTQFRQQIPPKTGAGIGRQGMKRQETGQLRVAAGVF